MIKAQELSKQDLEVIFDVMNVYDPNDISHVYPEMGSDEFVQQVGEAWRKLLDMVSEPNDTISRYYTYDQKKLDNLPKNWDNYNMTMIDKPEQIAEFRLRTLSKMLKLEILGMTRRGQSAYSIIKQETGLKGSKQKVYDQLDAILNPPHDVEMEKAIYNV